MIAPVAAWSLAIGPVGNAHPASRTEPAPNVAARVKALISKHADNTQIVTFPDQHQAAVKVVRGKGPPPGQSVTHDSSEIITFADKRTKPLRIMRGGSAVAAISVASSAAPAHSIDGRVQVVAFASSAASPVTVLRGPPLVRVSFELPVVTESPVFDLFHAARGADLDRIAFAVDGAESSHGTNPAMWRPRLSGPQGPMQVSEAAAIDSGGGDRFDMTQNRLLGRSYLALLFRRYGNWPDAVAAYNWGPGNLDAWIAQGRPIAGLPLEVERYRERVLRDGGILEAPNSSLSRTGWLFQTP